MSLLLQDTISLSKRVIQYQQHFNSGEKGGDGDPLVTAELTQKVRSLEEALRTQTEQLTQLSSQSVALQNQLTDTKEMLFQAETSLH
jgi:small-conductance mechanosensitive channel